MPVAQWFSRIPTPSYAVRRTLTLAILVLQAAIAVTGAVVRVTGSGLGCPTWPQCFPGSMVPISNAAVAPLHQWIEYGNRMLTGMISVAAVAVFLVLWRARPSRRVFWLALSMPAGIVVQAVVGGMTVLLGLAWWTVCIHLLLSPPLVWLAVLLNRAVREERRPAEGGPALPRSLRLLIAANGVVLTAILIAGTLVTAAGPHAGDAATPRLDVAVSTLAQIHASLLFLYVGMLVVLGFGLRNATAARADWRRYWVLLAVVVAQGILGEIQYAAGVPDVLVILHVLGAMLVTIATATMWAASARRPAATPSHVATTELVSG